MPSLNKNEVVVLEHRLAELTAQPDSDLAERVRLQIELFESYESERSSAQLLPFVEETYTLAQQLLPAPNTDILLPCLAYLTLVYARLGQLDQAIQYGLNGLTYVDANNFNGHVSLLYRALGMAYIGLGKFEEALQYNQQALDVAIALNLPVYEGRVYINLGFLYDTWGKNQLALEKLLLTLRPDIYEFLPDRSKSVLHNNIATEYIALGDLDAALNHAQQAVQVCKVPIGIGTLGEVLTAREEYEQAQQAFNHALALAQPEQDRFALCAIWLGQGKLYYQQDKLEAAITALEQALEFADTSKNRQAQCLYILADLYSARDDYARALTFLRRYQQIKDELSLEHVEQWTRALEVEHRSELARREAELARQEILRERNIELEQLITERDQALEQQQQLLYMHQALIETVTELSTPVLPLLSGVLILPIIGSLDSQRVARMTETLLDSITKEVARVVLLDITGVPVVDTQVASAIMSLAQAVKLLGCHVVMVGIRPEIAQTLVGLGVTFRDITTHATLAEGFTKALAMVGMDLMRKDSLRA